MFFSLSEYINNRVFTALETNMLLTEWLTSITNSVLLIPNHDALLLSVVAVLMQFALLAAILVG